MILTAEAAREVLSYDPATGGLSWKVSLSNRMAAGKAAGSINRYRLGTFDTPELAHAAYRAKAIALNGAFARTE